VITATATDIIMKSNAKTEFTPDTINMAAMKLQPTFVSSVNSQILYLFFYVLVYFYSSLSGKK
jgi:hypothetical protein